MTCSPSFDSNAGYDVTGGFGIFFFVSLCLAALAGLVLTLKTDSSNASKRTQILFFTMTALFSLLELPRYFQLITEDAYKCSPNTWPYSFHLLASGAFFTSYSAILFMWFETAKSIRKFNGCIETLFSPIGLGAANITFLLIIIVAIIVCSISTSNYDFFDSDYYAFYIVVDGLKNVLYFGGILFTGCMLTSMISGVMDDIGTADAATRHEFYQVLCIVNVCVGVCLAAFTTRFIMLCVKLAVYQGGHDSSITVSGVFWWWLADFIPRIIPSSMFIAFQIRTVMRYLNKSGMPESSDLDTSTEVPTAVTGGNTEVFADAVHVNSV